MFRDRTEEWYYPQLEANKRARWILGMNETMPPNETESSLKYYGMGTARWVGHMPSVPKQNAACMAGRIGPSLQDTPALCCSAGASLDRLAACPSSLLKIYMHGMAPVNTTQRGRRLDSDCIPAGI